MTAHEIGRRRFMQLSAMGAAGLMATACGGDPGEPEADAPATPAPAAEPGEALPPSQYNEAPMLSEMVQQGVLPPVDERLPENPLVIDLPWAEVGQYGGTLRRSTTASDFGDTSQYMYGHSPFHWADGGIDVQPGLAESWEVSDDASVWTIHFRQGTRWSDGEPFTVDDVIFWWEEMALNNEHPEPIPAWAISGGETVVMEKVDDYTLRLTYAAPTPLTDFQLAAWVNGGIGPGFGPVPRHYMEQFHPDYSDYDDFETFIEREEWWTNPERPVLTAWRPVELEPGQRFVLERNPYYYAIDRAGNQLPYIDSMVVTFAENPEVLKLRIINGEVNIHCHPHLSHLDLTLLRDNEDRGDYRLILWDNGAGGAPAWGMNWNQPDPEKAEIYRTREFRRALSHAMNRPRIKSLTFLGLGGELSTGTMSPKAAQFQRSEEGQRMLEAWRNLAVEYDAELAMSYLDEIGVVDQNGDGWRELPSGAPLSVRIDFPAGNAQFVETADLIREDWQAVGLNASVNTVPGEQLGVLTTSGTFDVRIWAGGAPDGPDLLIFPEWLVSYGSTGRWAPLYGAWMSVEGTAREGTELDLDPRDRSPAREEPPENDPMYRMWQIYKQAIIEPDLQRRDELTFEIIQIHLDEGPFLLGGVANPPNIVIAANNLRNIPNHDEIPLGGWLGPWVLGLPGAVTYPEQYYFG